MQATCVCLVWDYQKSHRRCLACNFVYQGKHSRDVPIQTKAVHSNSRPEVLMCLKKVIKAKDVDLKKLNVIKSPWNYRVPGIHDCHALHVKSRFQWIRKAKISITVHTLSAYCWGLLEILWNALGPRLQEVQAAHSHCTSTPWQTVQNVINPAEYDAKVTTNNQEDKHLISTTVKYRPPHAKAIR